MGGTDTCQFHMEYSLIFGMLPLSASELNCEANQSRVLIQSTAPYCCSHGGYSICDPERDDDGTDDNPSSTAPSFSETPSITPSSEEGVDTGTDDNNTSPPTPSTTPSSEEEEFAFDFFLSNGCRLGGAAWHALSLVGAAVALARLPDDIATIAG